MQVPSLRGTVPIAETLTATLSHGQHSVEIQSRGSYYLGPGPRTDELSEMLVIFFLTPLCLSFFICDMEKRMVMKMVMVVTTTLQYYKV